MNDHAPRRTFIGAALAPLASLVARRRRTLAQSSAKAHSADRISRTVASSEAPADVTSYSYDRHARIISITHAAK